ncbi:hypothetical protein [Streptomyces sp. HUAS ZL42]|uniref:hypothetical protein n=1 Tax=Streptomyces sp. HUAS ZL42 TaxID=3231715 RepID=UPI00345EEC7F
MLFPDGFWTLFTLIVLAGMAATTAAAVLISAITSRHTATHRPGANATAEVPRLPHRSRAGYPKAS